MNRSYQYRNATSFSIEFPDFAAFKTTPHNFRLIQRAGKQDIVEITYPDFTPFYQQALKTGVMLSIKWSNGLNTNTWYGYVYDVSPTHQQSLKKPVMVRAIGSSFGLKNMGNKIWVNRTATEIVEEIAKKFKLKPKITTSKVRFSQQSMVNHTYWEKLKELAHRIGYVVQVDKTELHFHPLDVMIDKFATTIPVLYHNWEENQVVSTLSPTLDKFIARVGDTTEGVYSKRDKQVSGVDPVTGKSFSVSHSPSDFKKTLRKNVPDALFTESLTSTITASPSMAREIVKAQAVLSHYSIHAEGSGQGDPLMAPYRTIEINGTGDSTDGFWVIEDVEHFVTHDGRYYVDFTCMTDGTGNNKGAIFRPTEAGTVPVRNLAFEASTEGLSRPTSTRISASTTIVNRGAVGYKVAPRRWVGK
jgi:phage protein D